MSGTRHTAKRGVALALLLSSLAGCHAVDDGRAPTRTEPTDAGGATLTLSTDAVRLDPGEERPTQCQAFELHNDGFLYLGAVELAASRGVHHSTWLLLPSGADLGPKGAADCATFGVGSGDASMQVDGGVVFSQATESTVDRQSFGDHAAVALPPHSRLLAWTHLLNLDAEPATVTLSATLSFVPASGVATRLQVGGGSIALLAVPPGERSRFYTDCSFPTPADYGAYFMVPHYHSAGTGMRFELLGGPRDGEVVWDHAGTIGDAPGVRIAPPVSFAGATGFRFGCAYDNTSGRTLVEGNGGNEMCSFYLHTDAPKPWYAVTAGAPDPTIVDHGVGRDGVHVFEVTGCTVL